MKYCKNCGNPLDDKAVICPKCGVPQEDIKTTEGNSNGWGWFFLGFFSPLVGLILFCVWRSSRPNDAKKAGLGALTGATLIAMYFIIKIIQACCEYYQAINSLRRWSSYL